MIEYFINVIVKELGPVGILVIGLYLLLGRPLINATEHLKDINNELETINNLLKDIIRRINGKT